MRCWRCCWATGRPRSRLVQATWRAHAGGDFDAWWQRSLRDGVIAGSAPPGAHGDGER